MKKILLAGTLDTKKREINYIKELLERRNLDVKILDFGVFESDEHIDFSSKELLESIGEDIAEVRDRKDRAHATELLARAMETFIPKIFDEEDFQGIISLGGSGGTSIATAGMKKLPLGIPKIVISTMTSGNIAHYVGTSDIIMMPSIVDVSGLNDISRIIFNNAANAMAGMVGYKEDIPKDGKKLVAASMFGLTTPCVNAAMEHLEDAGYEVIVFHATGAGGKTLESLARENYFTGILDLTTTEWCDELFGGVLNAGPNRLDAAAENSIPQVVSLGALDMVNFGPIDSMPEKYKNRNLYKHNPSVTLMRTNVEENIKLGEKIAEKLNKVDRETVLLIPKKGLSGIDIEGGPFFGRDEDEALFDTLKDKIINENVKIIELDNNINDGEFAKRAAEELIRLMEV